MRDMRFSHFTCFLQRDISSIKHDLTSPEKNSVENPSNQCSATSAVTAPKKPVRALRFQGKADDRESDW